MRQFVIPTVFSAQDKFSPAVDKMQQKVSNFVDKSEAKINQLDRSFRKFGNQAQTVGVNAGMFAAAIIAPLGLAANAAMNFEASMSNVSTLIDTNVESMDKMGSDILAIASVIPAPIEELTSSLYDIRSAGVSANDAMLVLEASGRLAASGLATTSEATNMMTSAINAFKSEGLEAAEISDILFKTVKFGKTNISELTQAFGATAPIVQSAGITLADFSAATAALTTVGTPAAQAQNQIRASIIALQKPTADMEKVFRKLGVTTGEELIQKSGGLVNAYEAINKAGGDMSMNMAKAWSSTEALAAVTSLTGATNEAYTASLNDMVNGANAIDTAFDKQSETMKSQMQIAKNNIQGLGIQIGQALLPVLADLLQAVLPLVQRFAGWMKENKALVGTVVKAALVVGGLSAAVSGVAFALSAASKLFGVVKFALVAFKGAAAMSSVAMGALNAVMLANPVLLVVAGVVALSAAIYGLVQATRSQTMEQRLENETTRIAAENSAAQRSEVKMLFAQLRQLTPETDAYRGVLAKIEAIQPGITEQYNLQKGAVQDLARAERDLTAAIMERAMMQAREEQIKEAATKVVELEDKINARKDFGMIDYAMDWLGSGWEYETQGDLDAARGELDYLVGKQAEMQNVDAARVQRQETFSSMTTEEKQKVEIMFTGLPEWMQPKMTGGGGLVSPKLSSTMQ